jgi:purine-binding chemotaxis protein CheW
MKKSTQENIFELDVLSVENFPDFSKTVLSDEEILLDEGEKFIVFVLNEIQYAIPSNSVSEVIRQLNLTPLYNVPEWFLGIANLRGDIISVVDLQKLWKQENPTLYSAKTKLIVLRCEDSDSLIAFKVDKLREIVTLSNEAVQPPTDNDSPFLIGRAEHNSGVINLLDVENVLCSLKLI